MRRSGIVAAAVLAMWAVQSVSAAVRLPALFSEHMVLQRDTPIPIWGEAAPGERIEVALGDRKATAEADAQGRWRVQLAALPAGGPLKLTVKAANAVELDDILIGDVWLCAGQSNMVAAMKYYGNAADMETVDLPLVRFCKIGENGSYTPKQDARATWNAVKGRNVEGFSSIGFYFARQVQPETGVPIGLVQSAIGGTAIQVWMSRECLASDAEFKADLEKWQEELKKHPDYDARFEQYRKEWTAAYATFQRESKAHQDAVKQAKEQGQPVPKAPVQPRGPFTKGAWSTGYAAMIAPLTQLPIKGVLWYQGESNAGRAASYRRLLPMMIAQWRADWHQPDLPFFIVQLPRYHAVAEKPGPSGWATIREAQALTARTLKNCWVSINLDLGEAENIHPKGKDEVARRLALLALAKVYGRDLPCMGPLYRSMKIDGNGARVSFDFADAGLTAKGDGPLTGFEIAGADRRFVRAEARIDGKDVIVRSPDVPQPVAVRYAWADNPVCNLFNRDGFPASTFRTDDWEE